MSKYETTIENGNEEEIEVEVDFDFSPAEKMTHDYPGYDAQLDINYVETVEGRVEIELSPDEQNRIEEEIMDWIDNYNDERWDY